MVVNWSGLLYDCDNTKLTYELAKLNIYTPGDMRAPGATLGVYALEAAMDELAYATGVDPIELRLKNYAEKDRNEGKPFSSKELRACYSQGAERFGWSKRTAEPRSMREGRELIGWGMATGVWEAMMQQTSARAILTADGKLEVATATADIGTGTYTIMAQIAADELGVPIEDVTVKIGEFVAAEIAGRGWFLGGGFGRVPPSGPPATRCGRSCSTMPARWRARRSPISASTGSSSRMAGSRWPAIRRGS